MNAQSSNHTPRDMFVSLWLRSISWSMIYGSIFGSLVIVLLFNSYGLLVWAKIIPSNTAYYRFCSTLNAMLVYIPFEIVAGALIGGGLGMLQGVFTGLVIGRVTITRFYPPNKQENARIYRQITGRLSIIWGFFITLLALVGYIAVQMVRDNAVLELGDVLIVTITVFLITYAAWRASQRVCCWYIDVEHQAAGVE